MTPSSSVWALAGSLFIRIKFSWDSSNVDEADHRKGNDHTGRPSPPPLCVFRGQDGLQEESVWDSNTNRQRRRVLFPGDEDDGSASSSEDEEEEEEEESDHDEESGKDLSAFLKEARGQSEKTTAGGAPLRKRQRLEETAATAEVPAFADSEDELEVSEEEEDEGQGAGDSGNCSEEDEETEDDDSEEEDAAEDEGKRAKEKEMNEEEEEGECPVIP